MADTTIQMNKKRAFGFAQLRELPQPVLFHCGGLDLYPRFATHPKAECLMGSMTTGPLVAA
jgi:hypothetical protein